MHWIINHSYKLCQICNNYAFKYDSDRLQHEMEHLPFGCSICDYEFNTIDNDTVCEHYKKQHESFLCKFCSSIVSPGSKYPLHLEKKHNQTNVEILHSSEMIQLNDGKFDCHLCEKKRKIEDFIPHFAFYHNYSVHAMAEILSNYPDFLVNGTSLDDNEDETMDDGEDDLSKCNICENEIDEDSTLHGVFCKGFIICKERQCEQLFKNEAELSNHLDENHPKFACKFGCQDIKLTSTENENHLQELHDIIECYFCNFLNSSGNFKNHLRDKHKVNLVTYENSLKNTNSKLYRVEIISKKQKSNEKKKVLCNFCDEDITSEIREFSFRYHYENYHEINRNEIVRNISRNPIIESIQNELQMNKKIAKNFELVIDESSINKMKELDFDTSKVSCVGYDDHINKNSQCEFCQTKSFKPPCRLYQHLKESHGFQLSNVQDYCNECEIPIADTKPINEEGDEDNKDFNLSLVCPFDYTYHVTKENFHSHMTNDHHQNKSKISKEIFYKCLECNFTYDDLNGIREHFKTSHPSTQMDYCRICRYKFKDSSDETEHMKSNHPRRTRKKYQCKKCRELFERKSNAFRHVEKCIESRKKKGTLKCMFCEKFFIKRDDRNIHYAVAHPDQKSLFNCNQCEKKFNSKSALFSHKKIHKNEFYKCEHCGKAFTRNDSYREHLLIHSNLRHKCGFCEKNFVQRSNLVRHERIHTGTKPYKCQFCEKTFSDKGAQKSHENVHTKAEFIDCEKCGKTFSRKAKLNRHMKSHSMEDVYKCQCGHICLDKYTFKMHQTTHQLNCIPCDLTFKTSRQLKAHQKQCGAATNHLVETKIICTICNKETKSAGEIKKHLKEIHQFEGEIDWEKFIKNVEFEMN